MANYIQHISQRDLRNLAERAVQIFGRNHKADIGLAAFEKTLVPAATAYISLYDETRRYQATKKLEVAQAVQGFSNLHKRIRVWLGTLAQNIPDFDAGELIGDPGVPEQLLADAKRLMEQATVAGEGMPFGGDLIADLWAAVEVAQKQWAEAQAAMVKLQAMQAEVREAAVVFNRQLVAFRRTMRASLGSTHHDYRKLLAFREREAAAEDVDGAVPSEIDDDLGQAPAVAAE